MNQSHTKKVRKTYCLNISEIKIVDIMTRNDVNLFYSGDLASK